MTRARVAYIPSARRARSVGTSTLAVGEAEQPPSLVADYHGPGEAEWPAHEAHGQFDVAFGEGVSDGGAADGEVSVLDYVLADDLVSIVLTQLCQGLKVSLAVLAKGEVLPTDEGLHVESFGESLHEFSSP